MMRKNQRREQFVKQAFYSRDQEGNLLFGWKHMAITLWNIIFPLMKANLCFILFSIPVVTIPASMGALHQVCLKLVRTEECKVFSTYCNFFRESFFKSWRVFLVPGTLLILGVVNAMYYFSNISASRVFSVLGLVTMAVAVIAYMMIPYTFVLNSCTELGIQDILKDSFCLVFLNVKFGICSSAITIAVSALLILWHIHMIPLILTCGFAVVAYVSTYFAMYGVQRYVLTDKF